MQENCPICEGTLVKVVSSKTFEYKGATKTINDFVTHKCEQCDESIVDPNALKTSGRILKDFKREVDGLLSGAEIKRIRTKLNLTQTEMSEVLGGGLKAFTRYESGQISQSKAMNNLLLIFDKYPHVINSLRKDVSPNEMFVGKVVVDIREHKNYKKIKSKPSTTKTEMLCYGT